MHPIKPAAVAAVAHLRCGCGRRGGSRANGGGAVRGGSLGHAGGGIQDEVLACVLQHTLARPGRGLRSSDASTAADAGDAWADGGPAEGTWAAWLVHSPGGAARGPVERVREQARLELRAALRHAYLGPEARAGPALLAHPAQAAACTSVERSAERDWPTRAALCCPVALAKRVARACGARQACDSRPRLF